MNVQITYSSARTVAVLAALAIGLSITGCKSAAPALDDAAVTTALKSRLGSDGAINSEPIQASVQNGIATLDGTVSSEAARSLAANDAAQVQGVKTVVNNLTVQQTVAPPVEPAPAPAPEPVKTDKPAPVKVKEPKKKPAPVDVAQNDVPPPPAPVERPAPAEQAPPPPPPPPEPTFRDVTIPSGTTLPIRITQTLDSATTQQGDSFSGTVSTDIIIDGLVAIPQGSTVNGRVSEVHEAAHFKGSSLLTVELTNLNRKGERIPIATDSFSKEGNGRGKNTAEKVGGGAAVGAILGGILGGGKGAAIGAAAGGGVGAGANAITKGQQVQIPSETLIRFKLTNAIVVRASLTRDPNAPADPNLQRRPANQ